MNQSINLRPKKIWSWRRQLHLTPLGPIMLSRKCLYEDTIKGSINHCCKNRSREVKPFSLTLNWTILLNICIFWNYITKSIGHVWMNYHISCKIHLIKSRELTKSINICQVYVLKIVPWTIELEIGWRRFEKLDGGVKRNRKSSEPNYSYIGSYRYNFVRWPLPVTLLFLFLIYYLFLFHYRTWQLTYALSISTMLSKLCAASLLRLI